MFVVPFKYLITFIIWLIIFSLLKTNTYSVFLLNIDIIVVYYLAAAESYDLLYSRCGSSLTMLLYDIRVLNTISF